MKLKEMVKKIENLPTAINSALNVEVTNEAKDCIKEAAESVVYSYQPKVLYSRRMSNGGLIDEGNMISTVNNMTLTVDNITPLQNLFGGNDTNLLTPIVEQGVKSYHMPYPRPFMSEAENMLASGRDVRAIAEGLRRQGYVVSITSF